MVSVPRTHVLTIILKLRRHMDSISRLLSKSILNVTYIYRSIFSFVVNEWVIDTRMKTIHLHILTLSTTVTQFDSLDVVRKIKLFWTTFGFSIQRNYWNNVKSSLPGTTKNSDTIKFKLIMKSTITTSAPTFNTKLTHHQHMLIL